MTIREVRAKERYSLRGDIVYVTAIRAGKTERSARVCYRLERKARPNGVLNVGDAGEMGVVNFAAMARPL